MANLTSAKMIELHTTIKEFDGGVKRWIEACETNSANFYKALKSKSVTEKRKDIYKVGMKVLKDLQKEEVDFFKQLEQIN